MKEITTYLNKYAKAITTLDKLLCDYKDNGHYPPETHISLDEIKIAKSKVRRHRRELLELIKERLNG